METPVESAFGYESVPPGIAVRLLGTLRVTRDGVDLELPTSRKVRALLAYLILSPAAVGRSQLCDMLWDVPNDPRGELRWCLSKIRSLVDEPGRRRVVTRGDTIRLDLDGCNVDALEVGRAMGPAIDTLSPDDLRSLVHRFNGELLEGFEFDRNPLFHAWLTAERRRFRSCHAIAVERLAQAVSDEEALGLWERLVRLAPYDRQAHAQLFAGLARRGQIREAEEHLAATVRAFEADGLDPAPLREAWRAAKATATAPGVTIRSTLPADRSNGMRTVPPMTTPARRASIAVMPFPDRFSAAETRGGLGDALAHDVIARLAKLRCLFVIAQGTVFALDARQVGPEEAGRMLDVDYVVGGHVDRRGSGIQVDAKLGETRTGRVLWADVFSPKAEDLFLVLEEIGNRIVACVATEIETAERNRAILKPPDSLDAWEALHRGLWHMYRYRKADNETARHFFETAIRLDPTFSRAHAFLSFTHWQDAFQRWAARENAIERAYAAACQSLLADDRDPAAHWAMGRALWIRGRHGQSVGEFEQAVDLSPNFALGHYNLAFVHSTAGDAAAAIPYADRSRNLSPFDPMLFGMLGARAMALVRLGRFDEAAEAAVNAAARPNAFAHIHAIAAFTLALADRLDEARTYVATIHASQPRYDFAAFVGAFQFDEAGTAIFRKGASRLGMR